MTSKMDRLGAIWTMMVRTYEGSNGKIECEIVYGQDSNSNELNIFWLIPQYVIITMSEVGTHRSAFKTNNRCILGHGKRNSV